MTGAIAKFIRALLGLMHKKKALALRPDLTVPPSQMGGMPRSLRGRRST